MSYDEEEWEDEEEDDDPGGLRLRRGLALGFLAMVPMFVAYELSLGDSNGLRSTAELLIFRVFRPLGGSAELARRVTLVAVTAVAFVHCVRTDWGLGPHLGRLVAEGALGALVLGPVLLGLMHLFGDLVPPPAIAAPSDRVPDLARAEFVFGAAAYEELLFRVGAYGALFVVAKRLAAFFGGSGRSAEIVGESFALVGSSLAFSASHLALFTSWLGPGGEAFDLSVFTWRALAGMLLGLLLRWRGPGVAAWTHGLFNLALLLGAGPRVFL